MKLFPKLALTVSGLLIGTTLCLSLSFYLAERRTIQRQADQERRAILQNLTHIAQESFLTNDDLLMIKYTGWLQKWNPSLLSASVVGLQGQVLAHSQPSLIGRQETPEASGSEVMVLTEPVKLGTHWVATASVAFSQRLFEQDVRARLLGLQRRIEIISIAALGMGLMISFLLALSWTRPVALLARAAEKIGEGKYTFDLANTDRRRDELGFLSRSFQSMAEQLRVLDQMKEDFVSAVTHELRSPLGAIESYLNLIAHEQEAGIPPSGWQSYIERLRINTQRLTRFVNDLLDVAALERGKVALERQPVNVAILIQDVFALYAAKLAERKILGRTGIPADPPLVLADPDKIRQVLINLVSNAIKFTPEGGTVELGIEKLPASKLVRVYVKDSGVGISEGDLGRIFNKFEQVNSARQTVKGPKGTGLGLSICRALIELHGGTLGVESRVGEGSCFYFTLPPAPAASDAKPAKSIQGRLV